MSAPTQPKRRRLSKEARRAKIEVAALDLFAERGYHGTSIAAIAGRSGVTVPVVYDHFESKVALFRRLLERTREELLEMWVEYLGGDAPIEARVRGAIEAWATYVESHPFAPRMYFVESTGIPELQEIHAQIQAEARAGLTLILGAQPGATTLAGSDNPAAVEMASEVLRSGLTGLAIWWLDHPQVERSQIVEVALDVCWFGLQRVIQVPGDG